MEFFLGFLYNIFVNQIQKKLNSGGLLRGYYYHKKRTNLATIT